MFGQVLYPMGFDIFYIQLVFPPSLIYAMYEE